MYGYRLLAVKTLVGVFPVLASDKGYQAVLVGNRGISVELWPYLPGSRVDKPVLLRRCALLLILLAGVAGSNSLSFASPKESKGGFKPQVQQSE
jgi:hypothetical protein